MQMNLLITIKMVEWGTAEQLFREPRVQGQSGSRGISRAAWDFPEDICPGAKGTEWTVPKYHKTEGWLGESRRKPGSGPTVQAWPFASSRPQGLVQDIIAAEGRNVLIKLTEERHTYEELSNRDTPLKQCHRYRKQYGASSKNYT